MQNRLDTLVKALPDGMVLSSLRSKWPGLCAAVFRMSDSAWGVAVLSSEKIEDWHVVATAVQQVFTDLEFGSYMRHGKVASGYYVFQLVEFPEQSYPERIRGL